MNIVIDQAIYSLQSSGGISTLWRSLTPALHEAMPDCTFDASQPADVFISTYYQPAPEGVKSVVVVYDFIANRFPALRQQADIQWKHAAIARADAVVAISQWTADDVKRFTGKDAAVAYPATTLERASHEEVSRFRHAVDMPDNYVLVVGRRGLYKNVSTYFQAARLLSPAPRTLCIGGEPSGDTPHPLAKYWNLPAADLPAAYTGALCLVYPSLYEGFGLPVLEAYACGCPVICGSGGALAEINEAALVVDVTKPREIADALVKMSDPGVRIDHILRGYEVAGRFHWQSMANSVAAVIRGVVERVEV